MTCMKLERLDRDRMDSPHLMVHLIGQAKSHAHTLAAREAGNLGSCSQYSLWKVESAHRAGNSQTSEGDSNSGQLKKMAQSVQY